MGIFETREGGRKRRQREMGYVSHLEGLSGALREDAEEAEGYSIFKWRQAVE